MHTVVLVDDEPLAAIDAMHSIEWAKCGFEVSGYVQSSVMALDQLQKIQPDLVLVDTDMPEVSGFELLERAMVAGVRSTFVMISSRNDFEYVRSALRLGAADYFLKPLDPAEIEAYLKSLAGKLDSEVQPIQSMDPQFARILQYVQKHAFEKLRLDDLAEITGFNKNYICHLFRKQLGVTFIQYVTDQRMKYGCELLNTTFLSIEDVAQRCGYPDPAYFNRIFKKTMKMTPATYRRNGI